MSTHVLFFAPPGILLGEYFAFLIGLNRGRLILAMQRTQRSGSGHGRPYCLQLLSGAIPQNPRYGPREHTPSGGPAILVETTSLVRRAVGTLRVHNRAPSGSARRCGGKSGWNAPEGAIADSVSASMRPACSSSDLTGSGFGLRTRSAIPSTAVLVRVEHAMRSALVSVRTAARRRSQRLRQFQATSIPLG